MNYNVSPYVRQCYRPFSFSLSRQKEGTIQPNITFTIEIDIF